MAALARLLRDGGRLAVLPSLLLFLALGPALSAAGQEKEFHWSKIEVAAKLEADGAIHIEERQHYVFTGDYNGGERGFDLRLRQRLELLGVSRLVDGAWKKLEEGDLAEVDHYGWKNGKLRWRSRRPEDPPFDHTELVYKLDYRITNVVFPAGEGFALAHDFLFPNRTEVVESFGLDLEVDPAWQVRGGWQRHHQAGPLGPGEGYVVRLALDWEGQGEAPVHRGRRPFLPALLLILAGVAAGMVALARRFVERQRALGRFQPLPALPAGREGEWIERHLLQMRAEEVGALWDRTIGPPEVAALIARWVAEGKVRSRVEEKPGFLGLGTSRILHLEMLVSEDQFAGYERDLQCRLFVAGPSIDTERLRSHYKGTGFDPAGAIRQGLESLLESRPGWREKAGPAPAKKPTFLLFLAGALCLLADLGVDAEAGFFSGFFFFFPLIPVYIVSGIAAAVWRRRVQKVGRGLFWVSLLPTFYLLWLALFALVSPVEMDETLQWSPGYLALLGWGLVLLAICRSVLNISSSREAPEGVALRQWLAAARLFLERELRRESPGFSDAIFPYLLAFGLDRDVDRWFRAYGSAAATTLDRQRHFPATGGYSGGSSSGGGGGFTGGGGLFGGGGASAGWAAAATSVASGVAAPSSSGSSGGSSGGSSSGGGSGGAW